MKVYVVEIQGCEFGKTIGVFSTVEAARQFVEVEKNTGIQTFVDDYPIYEWEVDGEAVKV